MDLNVRGYLLKHEMDRGKMNALLQSVSAEISRSRVKELYSAQAALFALLKELKLENGRILRQQDYEVHFPDRYSMLLLEHSCLYPALQAHFGGSDAPASDEAFRQILRAMPVQPFAAFRLLLILVAAVLLAAFWITLRRALRRLNRLEKEMNRVRRGTTTSTSATTPATRSAA